METLNMDTGPGAPRQDRAFHQWRHRAAGAGRSVVLPDGCRDVLVIRRPGAGNQIQLTELDQSPRHVALPDGTEITGFRLRPGAVVRQQILDAIAADPGPAAAILGNELCETAEMDAAILALPGASPERVARDLGVSVRTLQRRFVQSGLPSRGRAGLRATAAPLAGIACDCGYSDQAHMTRDFARWFGTSPAQLRRDKASAAATSPT